jgi:hypothetical protein
MTSIERTAYPRLAYRLTSDELREVYTPSPPEIALADQVAKGARARLSMLVLLKCYQRLGYFPRPTEISRQITDHVRACLNSPVQPGEKLVYPTASLYRYQNAIRRFAQLTPYDEAGQACARAAVQQAAQVMVNPADLINVALDELSKQHYELPAFSALDRLVQRVRTQVNGDLFRAVLGRLTPDMRQGLEVLVSKTPARPTAWQRFKALPKSATLTHLQALYDRLDWLLTLGDVDGPLADVPPAKIRHFAAEAQALTVDELRDFAPPKRYTLLLCLIQQERVAARDHLIEMFLKRMARLHNRAKEALSLIRDRQRGSTEALLAVLDQVLQAAEEVEEHSNGADGGSTGDDGRASQLANAADATLGQRVRRLLGDHGGVTRLRDECAAIACYNDNNYLPLLWRFYRSHRPTLFRLARSLAIHSTTQDTSLTTALAFVLANEARKVDHLPADIRLDFASEAWQRLILVRGADSDGALMLDRRHLEICVFSCLAAELKTGDLYVEGSESYADYRAQLVPWEECAPQIAAYCREVGLPDNAVDFVHQLKAELTELADTVDRTFPSNTRLEISPEGEPLLKRTPRQPAPPNLDALEAALQARLPSRTLLEILCNVQHYTHWTRHFGPLSGSDPKLEAPTERHILVTFAYGCNLGAAQAAIHLRGRVTARELAFANQRHIDAAKLEAAVRDIIRGYRRACGSRRCGATARPRPPTARSSACIGRTCSASITSGTAAMGASPTTMWRTPTSPSFLTSSPVACGKPFTSSMVCSRTPLISSRTPWRPIRRDSPRRSSVWPICWASSSCPASVIGRI